MNDTDVLVLAKQFFEAIEAGDLDTVRRTFATEAVITTNFGGDSDVEQTMKVIGWLCRKADGLRYDVSRREATTDGFLQEHVLRASAPDGTEVAMPACVVAVVEGDKIVRMHEYLDPTHVEALSRSAAQS